MSHILIPVSVGEFLDRYCILEIKSERITDKNKVERVRHELNLLKSLRGQFADLPLELYDKLKSVNKELWDIEDMLRIMERDKTFNDEFINLARMVYISNDRRANIKNEINSHYGSEMVEVKELPEY